MTLWPLSSNLASTLVLAGAATGAAIGGNAAANALSDPAEPSPGTWAVAYAGMTATISAAAIRHNPPMLAAAVGVCFSASVTALTLGLGIVLIVARGSRRDVVPAVGKRASLILPTSLLALLIGFSGMIRPTHAAVLLVEGVAILPICARRFSREALRPMSIVQLIVAIALIVLSGWAAMLAASGLAHGSELFRSEILSALVLGPIVVLPMIPAVATLAENGFAAEAIDALVMLVLLNLCAVLPLFGFARPGIPIPLLTWRLDTLLLVAVGLLLLPPSIGRWALGKREGFALVVCFVVYLMITLIATLG